MCDHNAQELEYRPGCFGRVNAALNLAWKSLMALLPWLKTLGTNEVPWPPQCCNDSDYLGWPLTWAFWHFNLVPGMEWGKTNVMQSKALILMSSIAQNSSYHHKKDNLICCHLLRNLTSSITQNPNNSKNCSQDGHHGYSCNLSYNLMPPLSWG